MGEIKSSRSIPEHRQPRPPSPSAQSVEDSAREQRDRIERERKLADERSQNALKLQRKQRLQALIQKRKSNMAYLKKVHQGGCFWLNIAMLSPSDISDYVNSSRKLNESAGSSGVSGLARNRAEAYFSLGLSMSKILGLESTRTVAGRNGGGGLALVRAFSQLVEEWEYAHAGGTMQSVRFMMAKPSPCVYPHTAPIEGFADLLRPSIYKFQNRAVVYEHLQLSHVPFELDYLEVLEALCDQLFKLYDSMMHEECYSTQVVYDTIVRLDGRVKHHVINMVAKELTEVALHKVRGGMGCVRSLAGMASLGGLGGAGGAVPVATAKGSDGTTVGSASGGSSGSSGGAGSSGSSGSGPSPAQSPLRSSKAADFCPVDSSLSTLLSTSNPTATQRKAASRSALSSSSSSMSAGIAMAHGIADGRVDGRVDADNNPFTSQLAPAVDKIIVENPLSSTAPTATSENPATKSGAANPQPTLVDHCKVKQPDGGKDMKGGLAMKDRAEIGLNDQAGEVTPSAESGLVHNDLDQSRQSIEDRECEDGREDGSSSSHTNVQLGASISIPIVSDVARKKP